MAADLIAAEKAAGDASKAAAERQKRFNLLNSQFRKREAELQGKLAAAEGEAASVAASLQQALQASEGAAQVRGNHWMLI